MGNVKMSQKFNHKRSKVWKVLSRKEYLKEWYFDVQEYEFEQGKTFFFYEAPGGEFLHRCTFTEIVDKSVIEYSWSFPGFSKEETTIRWELEDSGDGTMLHFSHNNLERFADLGEAFTVANFHVGWEGFISKVLKNYLNGIRKLVFSIDIKATPEIVWNELFEPDNYEAWTSVFSNGSRYEGELGVGNRINFISNDTGGMYSNILQMMENRLMVFEHIGTLKEGKELPIDEASEVWTGSLELYRITPIEEGVILDLEVDVTPQNSDNISKILPEALLLLKDNCEVWNKVEIEFDDSE